jgi:ubiquitin-protein ligase
MLHRLLSECLTPTSKKYLPLEETTNECLILPALVLDPGSFRKNDNTIHSQLHSIRTYANENANTHLQIHTSPSFIQLNDISSKLHSSRQQHQQQLQIHMHMQHHRQCLQQIQEEREQALRDYKVTIEYKHLKSHAPGGVYLVPTLTDLRLFHGIIFVRRGPFTNGVFKFQLALPRLYNDKNQHPVIVFSTPVYNPHVDYDSGLLDISAAYPVWDPSRHYLVTVLTFLKKIFYAKTFADAVANKEAKTLQQTDAVAYRAKVDACVRESQRQVFVNDSDSTAVFTEEELGHRVLKDLLKQNVSDPTQVSKHAILSMIDKASKV